MVPTVLPYCKRTNLSVIMNTPLLQEGHRICDCCFKFQQRDLRAVTASFSQCPFGSLRYIAHQERYSGLYYLLTTAGNRVRSVDGCWAKVNGREDYSHMSGGLSMLAPRHPRGLVTLCCTVSVSWHSSDEREYDSVCSILPCSSWR